MRKYWRLWGWLATAAVTLALNLSPAYQALPLWASIMVQGCVWLPYGILIAYHLGYWKGYERSAREYMETVFRIVGTVLHERK